MTDFRVADRDRFGWQDPVMDVDLTAPPVSPSEGDRYIVDSPATGSWAGHENDVAEYTEAGWDFYSPADGWRVDVIDRRLVYRFNGSSWVVSGGGGGVARDVMTWIINGPLVTGQNQDDMRVAIRDGRVIAVWVTIDKRGGNGSSTVDVNKGTPGTPHTTQQNDTTLSTIFTTQANRPVLAGEAGHVNENAMIKSADPDIAMFSEGDLFGIDLDSIAQQSEDLSVMIEVEYF